MRASNRRGSGARSTRSRSAESGPPAVESPDTSSTLLRPLPDPCSTFSRNLLDLVSTSAPPLHIPPVDTTPTPTLFPRFLDPCSTLFPPLPIGCLIIARPARACLPSTPTRPSLGSTPASPSCFPLTHHVKSSPRFAQPTAQLLLDLLSTSPLPGLGEHPRRRRADLGSNAILTLTVESTAPGVAVAVALVANRGHLMDHGGCKEVEVMSIWVLGTLCLTP